MKKSFQFLMNPQLQDIKPILAGAASEDPGSLVTPERNDCMILYYIFKGRGTVYINETPYPARAGQAFIIQPGKTASWQADRYESWSYQWIGFTGTLSHRFSELPPVFDVPDGVFAPLEDVSAVNTHTEYRFASELFMLFYLLLEPKREARSYVQRVADLIQASYMQKLSVGDIANQFGMDRSYLNRQFKKVTGKSIKEYITHVRLERAVWYLARGYSVKETAGLCGFNDVSNFSRAFKQHHSNHMSPQQWRTYIAKVHQEKSLLNGSGTNKRK